MKILIIGAGPAGLTAALELLRRGSCEVTVFEESLCAGGISRTVNHNGNRMDIGGHRFFSRDERVVKWWSEILPDQGAPALDDRILQRQVPLAENGPDPEAEDKVMLTRHRVSRIYYNRHFYDYPIRLNGNTLRSMTLPVAFRSGISYFAARAKMLPETNLENFYINRFGKQLYRMFFEGYTEKVWGRHPKAISADWGAQRVKGLSVAAALKDMVEKHLPGAKNRTVETSLIEQFSYPKYGPGQLWETVAKQVETLGGRILYGRRADTLMMEGNRVRGVIAQGVRYYGDIVLSSMPLCDLVAGIRNVPEDIAVIAGGLPYRDFITVGLLVERIRLRNETGLKTLGGIIPDCWIYVQDSGVRLGRIQFFNNWSPYMVKNPEHTVWMGLEYFCREGDDLWRQTDEEWLQTARGDLIQMGVIDPKTPILDSHREQVRKAYPAYFDTYADISRLREWLNGIEGLYCIGRNGQHRYNNMDHSMLTAFEAVEQILNGGGDKNRIWQVNTEQSYHEEK